MRTYSEFARAAALTAIAWSLSACEDLTSLNENPNAPDDVSAEFVLPQAIRTGVTASFGAGMMLSHTALWPGHVAQIQYAEQGEDTGVVRTENMNTFWSNYYTLPLGNSQVVVDKGRETGVANHEAIGLIWRSWTYHQISDLWGDIPYSEALDGIENSRPVYDSQEDVYKALIEDLAEAVALLNPGGPTFESADLLYGGDVENWRRFANSLRMRLAMRMVNKDPAAAEAAFVAAYNAGGFQSNADNAKLSWPGDTYENPLYVNQLSRDDHSIGGAIVDTLLALDDPRLALYAEPAAADGLYRGHYNGYNEPPQEWSVYSRIGRFWRADGATTPSMVLTYSELLFLQAEAAQRGWIGGNPAELYAAGIRANMTQYGSTPANAPTQAEIDAYLTHPAVTYSAATGLAQIHLQQWIGLFMNGAEAFAHWRRTGAPQLTPGPDLNISRIPVRFSYPDTEESFNLVNLNAALTRQGGGKDLVTPVWFMPE